jgi:V-type H+-transporting ATPase subunit H
VTASEAGLIKTIEKQPRDKRVAIIDDEAELYAATVVDVLSRITRDDVVKYILSLTGDFATESLQFARALLDPAKRTYDVLVKLLEKPDEQIHLLSSRALVALLTRPQQDQQQVKEKLPPLLSYICKKLSTSPNANIQDIAAQHYGVLLHVKRYRSVFWDAKKEIVPPLIKILDSSKGKLQLQYHTLLIFWLITFEKTPAADVITEFDLVPVLLDISKNSVKEKIIRLAVATLVNTANLAPRVSIPALLSHSALALVKTLSERKWADEELIEDLQTLKTKLQDAFDSMTTFDEYNSEIIGKKLKWSPPHRSDTFWKQNIAQFKDVDWRILKSLANIIASSNDQVTLAVGCNDISRIITELPESLKVLERLGTKVKIMQLMNSPDSDVRYEALKATQTFISHSFK